jgi:hypothetical protein
MLHGLFNFRIGPENCGNGSGNFQFPGPQRVDPEMVFIFSVDSSRVDAISDLLCSLVTAWKLEIANFFFRDGHKVGSDTEPKAVLKFKLSSK